MIDTINVDAKQASEWLYELFQQDTWLLTTKPQRHNDSDIEHQAVGFILSVAEQGVSEWGSTSQEVKETVSLLMLDFMANLMHPQSPLANGQWEVPATASNTQKVLEVIACEIYRSHPVFLKRQ